MMKRRNFLLAGTALGLIFSTEAAQAFLRGGISIGATPPPSSLTTATLFSLDGAALSTTVPFSFGLPIAPGLMAAGQCIQVTDNLGNVLSVQEDAQVTDNSSSGRWRKVTSCLVNAAATSISANIVSGNPVTTNPITVANLLTQMISGDNFECAAVFTMPDGTVYTAKATDALQGGSTWTYPIPTGGNSQNRGTAMSGPLATCWVCQTAAVSSGTAHPTLNVQFHITAFKTNPGPWNASTNPITGVECIVKPENGYVNYPSPLCLAYDYQILMGATAQTPALTLTGRAPSATLTVGSLSGASLFATIGSGTWNATSTTNPNAQDTGKAIVDLTNGGIGWLQGLSTTTKSFAMIPVNQAFSTTSPIAAGNWKIMGAFHASTASNIDNSVGPGTSYTGSWWGAPCNVDAALSYNYLKSSEMVLNYAVLTASQVGAPDLTQVNLDGCHPGGASYQHSTYNIKNFCNSEGQTSDVDPIGVMPYSYCAALVNWGDPTNHLAARSLLLNNARVNHYKPWNIRDDQTGGIINISDSGLYTYSYNSEFNAYQTKLPTYNGTNYWQFVYNHSGCASYLPYLLTGRFMYLENLCIEFIGNSIGANDAGPFLGGLVTPNGPPGWAVTISGSSVTATTGCPYLQGDSITVLNINNAGSHAQIAGSNIPFTNRYWLRGTSPNYTLYDTYAHALAGGATGLITFSGGGSNIGLYNGYNMGGFNPAAGGEDPRSTAWPLRTNLQTISIFPDSVPNGLINTSFTTPNLQRYMTELGSYFNANWTTNANYVAGGPRFLALEPNLTIKGGKFTLWQNGYVRLVLLNGYESGRMNANMQAFTQWFFADPIQWAVRTDIVPELTFTSYYMRSADTNGTIAYTYNGIYQNAMQTAPNQPNNDQQIGTYTISNSVQLGGYSASISDVSNPAAVKITLNQAFWDPSHVGSFIALGTPSGGITSTAAFTATSAASSTTLSSVSSFTNLITGSTLYNRSNANTPLGITISSLNPGGGSLVYANGAAATASGAASFWQLQGCGQITTVLDAFNVIVDSTVANWDGYYASCGQFQVGSGQYTVLPWASWNNQGSIYGINQIVYSTAGGSSPFYWLASASVEGCYQLGQDTLANYNAAKLLINGNLALPTAASLTPPQINGVAGVPSALKAYITSRI